jgi:hypothetical protein
VRSYLSEFVRHVDCRHRGEPCGDGAIEPVGAIVELKAVPAVGIRAHQFHWRDCVVIPEPPKNADNALSRRSSTGWSLNTPWLSSRQ